MFRCWYFVCLAIFCGSETYLRCLAATIIDADVSAIAACATETPGDASTRTTRASPSHGEKRARRGMDFLIAAAAATAVVYLALLCHRHLLSTKTSSNRELASQKSVEDCPEVYEDEEFRYYDDEFYSFMPDLNVSHPHEVPRGPARTGSLVSDCYREKGHIPVLVYEETGDDLEPGAEWHWGHVTERHEFGACAEEGDSCPESAIVAIRENASFSNPIGCYPDQQSVLGYIGDGPAPRQAAPELSCPLNSKREVDRTLESDSLNASDGLNASYALNCVYNDTCREGEHMVVMTADVNDNVTVVLSNGMLYSTNGTGLFKLKCQNDSQIILQFARQDINTNTRIINDFRYLRYQNVPLVSTVLGEFHLYDMIESVKFNLNKLFEARGDGNLSQSLKNAWRNRTTDEKLRKLMLGLRRTTNELKREAHKFLLKLEAEKEEAEHDELLRDLPVKLGRRPSVSELERMASKALARVDKVKDYNRQVTFLIRNPKDRRTKQEEDEDHEIYLKLTSLDQAVLHRRATGLSAHRLIRLLEKHISRDRKDLATARKILEKAKDTLRECDEAPDVSKVLRETEDIIWPPCARTTPTPAPEITAGTSPFATTATKQISTTYAQPLVGLVTLPVLTVVLVVIVLFIYWRKSGRPIPRPRLRQTLCRRFGSRSETSDRAELFQPKLVRVRTRFSSLVEMEADEG